jgi:hypothetical protein
VPGTQWAFGAVGNGRWTGVRLRDVLAKAGLKDSARHLLLDGYDVALGAMPKFQRTITVEKAMDPDTLLAYEMNGAELPQEHGFPVRVIVPGWASDSWVKWLRHVQVLDHEFEGFWMKTAYRHPTHAVTPGASVDPAEMVPVTDLNIKSVIATPAAGLIKRRHIGGRRRKLEARASRQGSQPLCLASLLLRLDRRQRQPHPHGARHQRDGTDAARGCGVESLRLSVERDPARRGGSQ